MQQSIICILDILGTKGIWTEQSVERYFNIIEDVETSILKPAKNFFKDLVGNDAPVELDFISFSDTLVITLTKTRTDKEKDGYLFHHAIEGFSQIILGIFQYYFSESFFLRGAISFGEIEKKGNHFVGPAVDDAAEYFELPDMIGVCFTPKATLAMEYAIDWNKKYFKKEIGNHVVKYKTPLKTKTDIDIYQINWPKKFYQLYNNQANQISVEARLSDFLANRNIPLIAQSKFANTIIFFRSVAKS